MTLGLLTAVDHRHEADLVATLELAAGDVQVVRRCADIPELVSVAAAGTADVAVVSATFRGVDREVFRALAGHGVRVVGMCERSDEAGERRLRQLGVPAIIYPDTEIPELLHALHADDAGVDLALALAGAPNARPGEVGIPVTVSAPGLTAEGESDWGPSLSLGEPAEGLLAAGPDDDEEEAEPTPQGRVVAIWGPVGAPGRTTVAVNLAADLAAHDLSVVLIDADTWGACIGQTLGLIDEAPGLAAAARLSDQGNLDVLALARLTPEVSPGLRVLTGLPRADRWPEARAGAVTEIVTLARSLARWVIVDCGFALEDDEELSYDTVAPRRNAATLAVLEPADEVVVVGAADPVGLQRLVRGCRSWPRAAPPGASSSSTRCAVRPTARLRKGPLATCSAGSPGSRTCTSCRGRRPSATGPCGTGRPSSRSPRKPRLPRRSGNWPRCWSRRVPAHDAAAGLRTPRHLPHVDAVGGPRSDTMAPCPNV